MSSISRHWQGIGAASKMQFNTQSFPKAAEPNLMSKANLFYAQSGGVTSVINASACGVIETARLNKDKIGKVYAGKNGIMGALNEELIDTGKESASAIAAVPKSDAFGT